MKNNFNLDKLQPIIGDIKELSTDRVLMELHKELDGRMLLTGEPGFVGGFSWKDARFIVADVTCHQSYSLVFMFEFWEESNTTDEPDLTVRMSLIPHVKTRLVLPVDALDSQQIFLPRTPGKQRSFVTGRKVDITKVNRFALGVREGWDTQIVEVSDVFISDKEPEYPLPNVKLVDEIGQLSTYEWKGKTENAQELDAYLKQVVETSDAASFPEEWSQYGGWKKKQMEAKGYFSVQHDGRRWWLVDPEGYVFFSTGLDCVRHDENGPVKSIEGFFEWVPDEAGEYADAWQPIRRGSLAGEHGDDKLFSYKTANMIRSYGQDWYDAWTKMSRANLLRWQFNTIGIASDPGFIKSSGIPHVKTLENFPSTKKKVYRDFPDVFSDEYAADAARFAEEQLTPLKDDVLLIGYFLRNEPQWGFADNLEIAEELLENEEQLVTKDVMISFLSERYGGDIGKLNQAWKLNLANFDQLKKPIIRATTLSESARVDLNDFSAIMIEQYVKVPSLAVKKVDPHHLNLGMRYAFILYDNQTAGKQYFDVFSINCYKIDPTAVLKKTAALVQMPVIIGEFHFGALDRGMQATGIIGVATQEDRGKAYQCYVEHSAAIPECVGTHYFTLYDQEGLGRFDGENYQIGLLDVCHRPYDEFVDGVVRTHQRMYEVADGTLEVSDANPVKIVSNIAS